MSLLYDIWQKQLDSPSPAIAIGSLGSLKRGFYLLSIRELGNMVPPSPGLVWRWTDRDRDTGHFFHDANSFHTLSDRGEER